MAVCINWICVKCIKYAVEIGFKNFHASVTHRGTFMIIIYVLSFTLFRVGIADSANAAIHHGN